MFAWIERFNGTIKAAKAAAPRPTTLNGEEAATRVLGAKYAEAEANFDEQDPTNLHSGDDVEVWPIDTGFRHRDRGLLIGIDEEELILQLHSKTGEEGARLHCPRTNFRIRAVKESEPKL